MRDQIIDRSVHRVTGFSDLGGFLSAEIVPPGILSIGSNGVPIDVMNSPADSDTTIVSLHGAIDSQAPLPMLVGFGVTRGLPASRIFISDPSLYISEKLGLSWYAGSMVQVDLQRQLVSIIERIVASTNSKNLIFFGSSGGGFAALALSRQFSGSLALAMNPQTSLAEYYPTAVDRYLSNAWSVDDGDLGKLPNSVQHDLVSAYIDGFENTVGYMQNVRDFFHIQKHLIPFINGVPSNPNVYVLMERWGEDGGDGHVPAPKDKIQEILTAAASCSGDWDSGLSAVGFIRGPMTEMVRDLGGQRLL